MEPERWQQIESVFQLALDCAPENRCALLETACGADAALRGEVESLLAAGEKSGFTAPAGLRDGVDLLQQRAGQAMAGRSLGPYRIIREIGHGGMGGVYLGARADEAFQKFVAIKILRGGLDTQQFVQYFRTERQILATLDHPHIARLLDGGATDDGLPYFVMEFIDGEPIDRYCHAHKLNTAERLKLFQGVCAAVRYAHENLVVHRDIKPGNVLVTKEGIPRLLDFGIAKLLAPGANPPDATVTAWRPFTPEFASPEQISGRSITTASDIYSLGALLYVLLTGRRPYRITTASATEMEAAICTEEPEKPSLAVMRRESVAPPAAGPAPAPSQSASAAREGTPEKLRRRLEGDLDAIVLMAMRKEPERRYASVEQLSSDVARHLCGLPVIARLDSRRYRAARFMQRHKAGVAAIASIFVVLICGLIVTLREARIAREQRDRARIQEAKAARINAFLQDVVGYSAVSPASPRRAKGHDATVVDMLDDAAQRVEKELNDQPEVKADLLSTIGNAYSIHAKYDRAQRCLREAYAIDLKLAPDTAQMARVTHQLANLAYLTGNYVEAESWYGQTIAICRRHANDPDFQVQDFQGGGPSAAMAAALSDAAFGERALGHFDQAEAMWREALAYAPRQGKYGFMSIAPKTYLAQLYVDRGDVPEADSMASAAAEELRAGGFVFQLPQALIDLGNVRRLERRYTEAESLIQEGTSRFARAQGDDNPNVAFGLATLAMTHYDEGEYRLAEQDARKALKIADKLPQGSHYYAGAITPLGLIMTKTGRRREGEALLREALVIRQQRAPRRSNVVAIALGNLGECLTEEKRYAEAEPLLTESYETLGSIQLPQSPVLRQAAERLAALYANWGKPRQAALYAAAGLPKNQAASVRPPALRK